MYKVIRCSRNQISPGSLYPGIKVIDMSESDSVKVVESIKPLPRGLYDIKFVDEDGSSIYDFSDRFQIVSSKVVCSYIRSSYDFGEMNRYFEYDPGVPTDWDDEIQEVLNNYGMKLIGWASAKDEYYDVLSDSGLDLATIARDSSGKIGLYLVAGDRVYDMDEEVSSILDEY